VLGIATTSAAGRRRRRGSAAAALLAAASGLSACAEEPARLVLLLTVDTLRADRLGVYGSDRDLTPHLDALAEESLVFTAAYAPASFTLPSVTSLLTGRYPEAVGIVNNKSALAESVPTLASELRAQGWRSAAVVSNFVLRRASGLATGFDLYDDECPQMEAGRNMPERTAPLTTDALLKALDFCTQGGNRHCFLWGHYQDPHGPYTPPRDLRARYVARERDAPDGRRMLPVRQGTAGIGGIPNYQYLDGEQEVAFYRAGYDAEIRHTDQQIGRLLDALRERELFDDALIVFAADHGEGLGENDYWFSHGQLLNEPVVRVPLFLRIPGRPPGRRDDVVSLVDLFPTLMRQLADATADPARPGRDLLAGATAEGGSSVYLAALGGAPVPRYGLIDGRFKLVVSEVDGATREQLFLRGQETVNLATAAPEQTRAMREQLSALRARTRPDPTAKVQDLSAEDLDRLRALGYGD
jgi:arylsulfatase